MTRFMHLVAAAAHSARAARLLASMESPEDPCEQLHDADQFAADHLGAYLGYPSIPYRR